MGSHLRVSRRGCRVSFRWIVDVITGDTPPFVHSCSLFNWCDNGSHNFSWFDFEIGSDSLDVGGPGTRIIIEPQHFQGAAAANVLRDVFVYGSGYID
jgi:hypothetical protein